MVCIVDRTVQVLTRPPLGLSSDVRSESWNRFIRAQNDEKLSRRSWEFMPQHASATFTAAPGPEAFRERNCEAESRLLRALKTGESGTSASVDHLSFFCSLFSSLQGVSGFWPNLSQFRGSRAYRPAAPSAS